MDNKVFNPSAIGLTFYSFLDIEFFHYLSAISEMLIALLSFYAFGAHIIND